MHTSQPAFDFAQTLRRNLLRAQCYAVVGATQEVISYLDQHANPDRIESDTQAQPETGSEYNPLGLDLSAYFNDVLRPGLLYVLDGLHKELKTEAIHNEKAAVEAVSMVDSTATNLQTLTGFVTQLSPYITAL